MNYIAVLDTKPTYNFYEAYLDDIDRGDFDCKTGYLAPSDETEAYYIGYGARYVFEQMKSAGEF